MIRACSAPTVRRPRPLTLELSSLDVSQVYSVFPPEMLRSKGDESLDHRQPMRRSKEGRNQGLRGEGAQELRGSGSSSRNRFHPAQTVLRPLTSHVVLSSALRKSTAAGEGCTCRF